MFYELAANSWDEEEIDAIRRVIESGRLTIGPCVDRFEAALARYLGRKYAVMVNSGSSANLIAVASLFYKRERPLQRGDEVIVPAIAWSTTYHPLQQYGLSLKFVDVELDTLNMDVGQLDAAFTPHTRMIVGVSVLGNPAALDVIRTFADKHALYFLEDNCESLDAELNGRKTGSYGDIATQSLFYSHHISTMEGGVLLTDDRELFHLARSLRAHGWARELPDDTDLLESHNDDLIESHNDDFPEAYRFILPGYNVRPLEICGAVGIEQLKKLPRMTEARRANWGLFQQLFRGDERFIIQRENGKSSCFCFTIVLNPELGLDRVRALRALKGAGIGYRMITGGCFHRHEVIRYYDYCCVGDLANANHAHDLGFFVGNHPFDLRPQIDRLYEVLDRTFA